MTSLRTAVALSLLTLPAVPTSIAFSAATEPFTEPLVRSSRADKSSDLIAKFENPLERAAAIEEIKALANKTPGKVRTFVMKQVGNSDSGVAHDALEAVVAIGKPMTRSIQTALASGEYKGETIPDSLAARMALRIDPTGKRILASHLEAQPLTSTVAAEIRGYAEPMAALQMLLSKAPDKDSLPIVLASLRQLRQGDAFAGAEGVADTVREQSEELGETMTQVLVDAAVAVDVEKDSARLEAWLKSGDPVQSESALRSIGGVGFPLIHLAPAMEGLLTSDSASTVQRAHWALRRLAVKEQAEAPKSEAAMAMEAGSTLSAEEREQMRLLLMLEGAQDGVLSFPAEATEPEKTEASEVQEPGAEAIKCWAFAPRWIAAMGGTLEDKSFGRKGTAWEDETLPSQIEELKPKLLAAMSSDNPALSMAAGISLVEWNVTSIPLLQWAVAMVASGAKSEDLSPVWSLLLRQSEEPWLKRTAAAAAFAGALKDEATEVDTVKLLTRMRTDSSSRVLTAHFAGSDSSRPWHHEHYMALHSIMALNPAARAKVLTLLGERFQAGDYRVAPLLIVAGDSAHPILEKALLSPVLDRRMIAVATLVEQGTRARALLPKLQELSESEPHAKKFLDDSIATIVAGK